MSEHKEEQQTSADESVDEKTITTETTGWYLVVDDGVNDLCRVLLEDEDRLVTDMYDYFKLSTDTVVQVSLSGDKITIGLEYDGKLCESAVSIEPRNIMYESIPVMESHKMCFAIDKYFDDVSGFYDMGLSVSASVRQRNYGVIMSGITVFIENNKYRFS